MSIARMFGEKTAGGAVEGAAGMVSGMVMNGIFGAGASGASAVATPFPLHAISLAVNASALGVAVYNTMQLQKLDRALGEVSFEVGKIEITVEKLQRNLEKWGTAMFAAIEHNEATIKEGFQSIHNRLDETERLKLENTLENLWKHYNLCIRMFVECNKVSEDQSKLLEDTARKASEDIDLALRTKALRAKNEGQALAGMMERWPLMYWKVVATEARIAVIDMQGPARENGRWLRDNLVKDGQDMVMREIELLLSSTTCTPFFLGCILKDALGGYAALHKGFTNPWVPSDGAHQKNDPEESCWEDGLEDLRSLLSSARSSETRERQTGWGLWSGRTSQSYPLVRKHIQLDELMSQLGVLEEKYRSVDQERDYEALERLSQPETWTRSEAFLKKSLEGVGLRQRYEWQRTRKSGSSFELRFRPQGTQETKRGAWKGAKCARNLTGHTGLVKALACAPDGTIYSGSLDQTIKQWRDGTCVQTLEGHGTGVRCLAVRKDGILFSGDNGGRIMAWWRGKPTGEVMGHLHGVYALAILPHEGSLLSGGADNEIRKWVFQENGSIRPAAAFSGHTRQVQALVVGVSGQFFSASLDGTVRRWTPGGEPLGVYKVASGVVRNGVRALALGMGGSLFVGLVSGVIAVWRDGKEVKQLTGHADHVSALAVSDDDALFSGSADRSFLLWRDGNAVVLPEHDAEVAALLFVEESGVLYSCGGKVIKEWHRDW